MYFFYFLEISTTDGKVWKGASENATEGLNKYVPEKLKIGKECARDIFSRNSLTLLAISYSSFSDRAIESFITEKTKRIPHIVLQPILNPLKWLLWSQFMSSSSHHFPIRGDIPESIEVFGMQNKYAGYVFLIDSRSMIRWKAAGAATDLELEQLNSIIVSLLKC